MGDAKRDDNQIPTLLAVSSVDGTTPVVLFADPTTHRLLVDLPAAVAGDSASVDKEFVRFNGTGGKTIESPNTDNSSVTATLSDNVDVTFYDATNDGNPVFSYGSSSAERMTITPTYNSGAQTLDYVEFDTAVASGDADKGEWRFKVDGTLIATIDDGGLEIKASGSLSFGAVDILTDSSGTTTLNNIDALDAASATTIATGIDAATTSAQGGVELATDAEALTGTSDVVVMTPGNLGSIITKVFKTSDETVNNSTSIQNDDDLLFAIAASETWVFQISVFFDSGTTPDIKFGMSAPSGATGKWCFNDSDTNVTKDLDSSSNLRPGGGAGFVRGQLITGFVINSTNAGSVILRWAQQTADMSDTKVLAGSHLIAHKIS